MKEKISQFIIIFAYSFMAFMVGFLLSKNESFNNYLLASLNYIVDIRLGNIKEDITVWKDKPEKVHDGLILLSTHFDKNPAAILVDADGKTIHEWNLDKEIINPVLKEYHNIDFSDEISIHSSSDSYLYPNGDLLTIQEVQNFDNLRGNRIVLIDKNSKVKWQIAGQYHHEFNITDNGNIFALDYIITNNFPEIKLYGINNEHLRFLNDTIKEITPEGKILREISVVEAFANSEFKNYLSFSNFDLDTIQISKLKNNATLFDPLHANSVQYLSKSLSKNIPFAEEGDLLVSLRGISAMAIIRPSLNKIVWLKRGSWRHQHHVNATDNGTILIYDNDGSSRINVQKKNKAFVERYPRVLEFNPLTEETKEIYSPHAGSSFQSFWKGAYYKLPDGSNIVLSSEQGRVRQVSNDNEIIWEMRTTNDRNITNIPYTRKIPMARYYEKEYADFLK